MTQEDKELLLKDLCSRLPYGVKAEKYTIRMDGEIVPLAKIEIVTAKDIITQDDCPGYIMKPYLFPLSSMTEKQYKEWCNLEEEPLDEILNRNANGIKMTTLEHHLLVAKGMIDPIQWCYKNHFDVYGLIPMGLANDSTGLNIY